MPVPSNVAVVDFKHVRDRFVPQWFGDEGDPKARAAAIRQAIKVCGETLIAQGYLKRHENWVWRTRKRLPSERQRDERDTGFVTPEPSDVTHVPSEDDYAFFGITGGA